MKAREKTKQAYISRVNTRHRATGELITRYEVRFRRKMPDGTVVEYQKRFDRVDIARKERDRVLTEIALGTYKPKASKQDELTAEASGLTVAEGLLKYIDYLKKVNAFGLSQRTENAIRALAASTLGAIKLVDLSGEHLDDYAQRRKEAGLAPSSVRKEVATVKRFRAVAHDIGLGVPEQTLRTTVRLRHGETRTRRPQGDELDRVLIWLRENNAPAHLAARLAVATAMRQGEIAGARWSDFDERSKVLWLRAERTKTRRARGVPLSIEALQIIQGIERNDEYILGGITAYEVAVAWRKACKAVGVAGLRFHDLRREAISRAAELGLGDRQLQLISGHARAEQLATYTALSPVVLGEHMRRLEAARQ